MSLTYIRFTIKLKYFFIVFFFYKIFRFNRILVICYLIQMFFYYILYRIKGNQESCSIVCICNIHIEDMYSMVDILFLFNVMYVLVYVHLLLRYFYN